TAAEAVQPGVQQRAGVGGEDEVGTGPADGAVDDLPGGGIGDDHAASAQRRLGAGEQPVVGGDREADHRQAVRHQDLLTVEEPAGDDLGDPGRTAQTGPVTDPRERRGAGGVEAVDVPPPVQQHGSGEGQRALRAVDCVAQRGATAAARPGAGGGRGRRGRAGWGARRGGRAGAGGGWWARGGGRPRGGAGGGAGGGGPGGGGGGARGGGAGRGGGHRGGPGGGG